MQFVVAAAPTGKLQFFVRVVDGRIAEMARGKSDPVDCTLQCSYALASALAQGTLDRDVAYMRGDLKIDGDYAAYVLRLYPLFDSDEFVATRQSLRERTEF
jgi:predicted lipid carrier protein YhbT